MAGVDSQICVRNAYAKSRKRSKIMKNNKNAKSKLDKTFKDNLVNEVF